MPPKKAPKSKPKSASKPKPAPQTASQLTKKAAGYMLAAGNAAAKGRV